MAIKRIFYVTAKQLCVFFCDKNHIELCGQFAANDTGQQAFNDYIKQWPEHPSALLLDVIEEEFRNEKVPHVSGSDRRHLLKRKMAKLFRDTPFRSVQITGRDKSGRKEDHGFFSALTRPDILTPWLSRLKQNKVPLVGIYSIASLTALLMKKLKINHSNLLVLSIQKGHLLRQTFINEDKLKISRLTPMNAIDDAACLNSIHNEVDKKQRYLSRLQLIDTEHPLSVVLLSEGSQLDCLREGCIDASNIHYQIKNINDIGAKIGLKQHLNAQQGEFVFAFLLSHQRPATNYAPKPEKSYFMLHQLRRQLIAASLVLSTGATAWSVSNLLEGQQFKAQAEQISANTQNTLSAYQQQTAALPALPYSAKTMRSVVDAVRQLTTHTPRSLDILTPIGWALSQHSNIRLEQLQWGVEKDGEPSPDNMTEAMDDGIDAMEDSMDDGMGDALAEVENKITDMAILNAHLIKFPQDYQTAFAQIEQFVDTLKQQKKIKQVDVLRLPLDLDPKQSLAGESRRNGDDPIAAFELKIWLSPHEQDA